jgi:hypothetical protein
MTDTTTTASPEKPLRLPNWLIGLSCLLLVGVGSYLYWASSSGMEEDMRRGQVTFEGRSDASIDSLRTCLRSNGKGLVPGADKNWNPIANGHRGYNPARHLFVDVEQAEGARSVRVWTRDGEALSDADRQQLRACIDE